MSIHAGGISEGLVAAIVIIILLLLLVSVLLAALLVAILKGSKRYSKLRAYVHDHMQFMLFDMIRTSFKQKQR